MEKPDDEARVKIVDAALVALEATAEIFAWRYLDDANARAGYVKRIADMADQMRNDVRAGRITAEEGVEIANQMRNVILVETRNVSSAVGLATAEAVKCSGLTLEDAINKATTKLFPGKDFSELNTKQKHQVFSEIIEASGRSNPKFTSSIPKWMRRGQGLAVITAAIATVNIWMAENKVKQGLEEGATLLGGALGGAAANASAGFLCGPAAPICVTTLFVIGGVAGALLANSTAKAALNQKEMLGWLGE